MNHCLLSHLITSGTSSRDSRNSRKNKRFSGGKNNESRTILGKYELKSPPYILDVIKSGYRLPLTSKPTPFLAKNNASSFRHKEFVTDSIQKLLKNNCISEVKTAPTCVADKSKLRLVIDLRHVNKLIDLKSFKYDN